MVTSSVSGACVTDIHASGARLLAVTIRAASTATSDSVTLTVWFTRAVLGDGRADCSKTCAGNFHVIGIMPA